MIDAADSLFLVVQIFFVDLLLGADNAIVIALACGRLRPEDTRRAIVLGAGGAIVLRLMMMLFANALLGVPLVKLAGAWMLIVIALNLRAGEDGDDVAPVRGGASDFVSAAAIITLADAAMSLDNVVALAAIAGGNLWLLALGVLMSIPILVWGAFILTKILRRAPEIFTVGAAFLGWIAGGMAATDPLVSGWIDANAPALGVLAPALGALFVLAAGKGAQLHRPARAASAAPPPLPAETMAPAPLAPSAAAPAAGGGHSTELILTPGLDLGVSKDDPGGGDVRVPSGVLRQAQDEGGRTATLPAEATADGEATPGFAPEEEADPSDAGWSEERLVVAGFVLLALVAGLIIFVASFYDSLT